MSKVNTMARDVERQRYELGGRMSVLDRQRRDHAELDRLLDQLQEQLATDGAGHADAAMLRIYRLAFPHAFAEESVLWPAVRRVVADGDALTLQVEREHQEINDLATAIEQMEPDEPARAAAILRMVDLLRQDVRDEEDVLLLRLEDELSARRLHRLGLVWEVVRRTAPTRAHPVVARRPPGNLVAALPLTVVDRLRDRIDAAIHHRGHAPRLLTSTSRVLTRAAHAVERLPLMSTGEHPSTRRR